MLTERRLALDVGVTLLPSLFFSLLADGISPQLLQFFLAQGFVNLQVPGGEGRDVIWGLSLIHI